MIADENTLETFTISRTQPRWVDLARVAAAIVARVRKPREEFEPDPFATEMPFLTDSWPRS